MSQADPGYDYGHGYQQYEYNHGGNEYDEVQYSSVHPDYMQVSSLF